MRRGQAPGGGHGCFPSTCREVATVTCVWQRLGRAAGRVGSTVEQRMPGALGASGSSRRSLEAGPPMRGEGSVFFPWLPPSWEWGQKSGRLAGINVPRASCCRSHHFSSRAVCGDRNLTGESGCAGPPRLAAAVGVRAPCAACTGQRPLVFSASEVKWGRVGTEGTPPRAAPGFRHLRLEDPLESSGWGLVSGRMETSSALCPRWPHTREARGVCRHTGAVSKERHLAKPFWGPGLHENCFMGTNGM